MKKIFTLLLCSALFVGSCWGGEIIVRAGSNSTSRYMPFAMGTGTGYSVSQQIYTASELKAAGLTAGTITGFQFCYASTSGGNERGWKVYITKPIKNKKEQSKYQFTEFYSPGALAYAGKITLPTSKTWYGIDNLTTPYVWDGESNIMITINDTTGQTISFTRYDSTYTVTEDQGVYIYNSSSKYTNITSLSPTKIKEVPKIKFFIETGGDKPSAPSNVQSSNITDSSAVISWDEVTDADSYSLRYKKSDAAKYDTITGIKTLTYTLNNLEDSVAFLFGVQTIKGGDSSSFSTDKEFKTLAKPIEYEGKTFKKWISNSYLPSAAGNYYMASDITVSSSWSVNNNINLCLNGKTLNLGSNNITITNNGTLNIYDNLSEGTITSSNNTAVAGGTIVINGTLGLYGGTVINTATTNNAFGLFEASGASIKLKGCPTISTNLANIKLGGNPIIIEGALTNTTDNKHSISVGKDLAFTSGWSTYMSGKQPADYFTSANTSASYVILKNNEAQLTDVAPAAVEITIGEEESDVFDDGTEATVTINRMGLLGGMYNTLSLPFDLTKEALDAAIGNTTVITLSESNIDDDNAITLTFSTMAVNGTLEHGKPYLVKPAADATLPTFNNVILYNGTTAKETDYVDFIPLLNPTALPQSKEILFMGQNNELFWPTEAGTLKGLRCYFKVKFEGTPIPAGAPVRMVVNQNNSTTELIEMQNASRMPVVHKFVNNGQLRISRNGVIYNATGQIIK